MAAGTVGAKLEGREAGGWHPGDGRRGRACGRKGVCKQASRVPGCERGRRSEGGDPRRGEVQGGVGTGEPVDKGKSLVVGFTPAAWKPAPASRSRHQRQPSGVATRDPRHKPPSREPRNRSEPGARRTHRLRSRPPLLRVGFSTTASSSWRERRRRWRAQASGAPGPAAPPAGLATPLPGRRSQCALELRPGGVRAGPPACGAPRPGPWKRPRIVQTTLRTGSGHAAWGVEITRTRSAQGLCASLCRT